MKMPLCLSFWCYMLLFITLSSESQLKLISKIDEQDDNSTVQYQLGANTVTNYDNEKDLIRYNSNENSIKDNGDMQYAYRINSTRNYHENDDEYYQPIFFSGRMGFPMINHIRYPMINHLIHPELQVDVEKNYKNAMSQKMLENFERTKGKNGSASHDFFKHFNRDNDKNNIVSYKMCENITCIRFCCPFGDRLVDGKCLAKQDDFIHLQNMYGYIDESLQNGNERINELFLLVVHDPCQKTKHDLIMPFYKKEFLIDGSLYLASDQIIVESTSYCFAVVEQNIFAVKVCPRIIERIMDNNYKNRNKSAIIPISTNKELKKIRDKNDSMSYNSFKNFNKDNNKNTIIPYKMCENITCIFLCCPFDKLLVDKKCIDGQDNFIFLQNMYKYINDSLQKGNEGENELFLLVVHDPCQKSGHYTLNSLKRVLLVNGSLYLPDNNTIVESTSYCFANVDDQFDMDGFGVYGLTVKVCFENIRIVNKTFEKINFLETELIIYICSLIGVILCLLMTFVVYSTIPELRNIHGYILCSYSGSLIVAYTVELKYTLVTRDAIGDSICIAYGISYNTQIT
ncbi:uncharacterized protein LOC115238500 [Formica exsecta]|uniref:uncharacterized protein LOC115238500 n=1 Tax=Formica exsecta TaxID=72781 RepID=UPI00114502C9|nr:uncharacterized protein LOC115238500 [Formica exsecta]